jgi:hypothetical protein
LRTLPAFATPVAAVIVRSPNGNVRMVNRPAVAVAPWVPFVTVTLVIVAAAPPFRPVLAKGGEADCMKFRVRIGVPRLAVGAARSG